MIGLEFLLFMSWGRLMVSWLVRLLWRGNEVIAHKPKDIPSQHLLVQSQQWKHVWNFVKSKNTYVRTMSLTIGLICSIVIISYRIDLFYFSIENFLPFSYLVLSRYCRAIRWISRFIHSRWAIFNDAQPSWILFQQEWINLIFNKNGHAIYALSYAS